MPIAKALKLAEKNNLDANLHLFSQTHNHASTNQAKQLDHLASITKVYAAVCFLGLEEQKQLSLSDLLSKYLPAETKLLSAEGVTVLDLLTHTSGIHDYYQYLALKNNSTSEEIANHPGWDFEQAIQLATQGERKKLRKSKASYSFSNYLLLDKILEQFGGFESQLTEQIINPMGLKQTFLLTKQKPELFAQASPLSFGSQSYKGFQRMASLGAEGALIASGEDVSGFLRALFDDSVIKNANSRLTQRVSKFRAGVQYGLGVMIGSRLVSGRRKVIGHFGATGSAAFIDVNNSEVAAVATNQFKNNLLPAKLLKAIFAT